MYSCKGVNISDKKPRSCNFAVWWDGDLLREILDRNYIAKWTEAGDFTILVGGSSRDLRLKDGYTLAQTTLEKP